VKENSEKKMSRVNLERSTVSGLFIIPYRNAERTIKDVLVKARKTLNSERDVVRCLNDLASGYEVALKPQDEVPGFPPVFPEVPYRLTSDFGQHLVCPPTSGPRPRFDLHPEIPLGDFVGHVGRYVLSTCFNTSKYESCGVALTAFNAIQGRRKLRTAEKESHGVDLNALPQIEKVNSPDHISRGSPFTSLIPIQEFVLQC
jgi:hypothetical protein